MKHWTKKELEEAGYKIENAEIAAVDLSMADHGCLTLAMTLNGNGWGCVYGGYFLGKGYVGAADDFFEGRKQGMESIIRIMDVVGSDRFNGMKNKIIRVATKRRSDPIKIIGNVIEEKWFDAGTFYNAYEDN